MGVERLGAVEEDLLHLFGALAATRRAGIGSVLRVLLAFVAAQGCTRLGARARRRRRRRSPLRAAPQGVCVGALLPLALAEVPHLAACRAALHGASATTLLLSSGLRAPGAAALCGALIYAWCGAWGVAVPLLSAALLHAAPRTFTVAEATLAGLGAACAARSHWQRPSPVTVAALGAALCGAHAVCVRRVPRILYVLPVSAAAPIYLLASLTLRREPARWLLLYLGAHWRLVLYWLVLLASTLTLPPKLRALHRVDARKLYHLLVSLIFLPALHVAPQFLAFASLAALAALLCAEAVRQVDCALARPLNALCRPLLDARDAGSFAVTHLYLLVGCAVPLWICGPAAADRASAAGGLITVGVQDAVAAVVGRRFGRIKWPAGQGRTVEGSVAGALAACALAVPWSLAWRGDPLSAVVATVAAAVLEAHSTQIDNLVLPLYFTAVYVAFSR